MATSAAVAVRGRFVWHDLQSPDPKAGIEFYTKLFGWGTAPFDGATGAHPYTLLTRNGVPFGGVMQSTGGPPSWVAHVATTDVDATARDVTGQGGRLIVPPTDIPTGGRFTVFSDPQGPVIGAYSTTGEYEGHDGPPQLGEFGWHELATGDYEKAFAFYHSLFGWDRGPSAPMGEPYGTYQMFARHDLTIGGMYNKPDAMPAPNHWVHYVVVSDVDEVASRVPSLGGMVMYGPVDVPGGPRIAMFGDPQGAMFAVYKPT